MDIRKKLSELNQEISRATHEAEVAGEQLAYVTETTEEARLRALVSGNPGDERAYREAQNDLERLRRHYERKQARVADLRRQQDELLEKLLPDV